jgi:anti-sigma factor RsiW
MDCHFVQNHLFSYQEQQLAYEEKQAFEAHLASCDHCNRIASGFQFVTAAIDKKKNEKHNPFIETRTIQRIESELDQRSAGPDPRFLRRLQPVIVSLLLLISVMLGFSIGKQIDSVFSATIEHHKEIQEMKLGLSILDFVDENIYLENN